MSERERERAAMTGPHRVRLLHATTTIFECKSHKGNWGVEYRAGSKFLAPSLCSGDRCLRINFYSLAGLGFLLLPVSGQPRPHSVFSFHFSSSLTCSYTIIFSIEELNSSMIIDYWYVNVVWYNVAFDHASEKNLVVGKYLWYDWN